ncbi:S24 family peptidase [Curvibacter lanceolatus]|uniref:S24 family peptidase n=1 Tax=Curvibacter lanceolatus TaxID=86182 RepID=UPI000372CAF5|nr:S24 family peptidase [Curvibacter lanceolatus]
MEKPESPRRMRRRLRLIQLLAEVGGAAQAARESDTPTSHFSALVKGRRGLGDELAKKFEEVFHKPPGWFDLAPEDQSALTDGAGSAAAQRVAIPFVEIELQPGSSSFKVNHSTRDPDPLFMPPKWFTERNLQPDRLFALRVGDDSMQPGLYRDDIVIMNSEATAPIDGMVYLVNFEGTAMLKRLSRDAGQWWLRSDNHDQRRFPVKSAEGVPLMGLIVHKLSDQV